MINVTVIDCSHKDRPSLTFTASEVISSAKGIQVLSAHVHDFLGMDAVPAAIQSLIRDIRQGFDLNLSHNWVVKVH